MNALNLKWSSVRSSSGIMAYTTLPLDANNNLAAQSDIRVDEIEPFIGLTGGSISSEVPNLLVINGAGF